MRPASRAHGKAPYFRPSDHPEDVVRTVLFLTRSPFITGEVVVVDGGRMMGQPGTRGPGQ
jgi:NAD(P)-dependent dehydrogenase (short-subunit alcohol dehydrogenase family)